MVTRPCRRDVLIHSAANYLEVLVSNSIYNKHQGSVGSAWSLVRRQLLITHSYLQTSRASLLAVHCPLRVGRSPLQFPVSLSVHLVPILMIQLQNG